jgi:hypothetical protein
LWGPQIGHRLRTDSLELSITDAWTLPVSGLFLSAIEPRGIAAARSGTWRRSPSPPRPGLRELNRSSRDPFLLLDYLLTRAQFPQRQPALPLLRPWRKKLSPPSFLAVSVVVNAGLAPGVPRDRGGRVSGGSKCVGGWTGPQFLNVDATPPLPHIVSWPAR